MMIFSREIIELLLTYKKFSGHDADLTANAMFYYLIGIPFFSITIILVKFYYAQKRSFIPMIISLTAIGLTIIFSYFLSVKLQVTGLSIARSIGYVSQALLLIIFIIIIYQRQNLKIKIDKKNIFNLLKMAAVTVAIFAFGFILNKNFDFSINLKLNAMLKIGLFGTTLSLVYLAALYYLKVPEAKIINIFLSKLRRFKKQ
jgi:putative peptidoglycan lipid II flippase